MNTNIGIVTVCMDPATLNQLKLVTAAMPQVEIQYELKQFLDMSFDADLTERLRELHADICVIDFDRGRDRALRTAERIHTTLPGTAIFAVSSQSDPELIIDAMRSGCGEYLLKPLDREQLVHAVSRVMARKRDISERVAGQILCFVGAKGGAGATTLAIHLAALMAQRRPQKTVLVDLHPHVGDVSLFLGLKKPEYHFYDLVENTERLDADLLQGFVIKHACGLDVLAAPDGFEVTQRRVSASAISGTLKYLRLLYEYVFVDCVPGFNEHNFPAVENADKIYLISTTEIPSLRNVARVLDYINRQDRGSEICQVVVNRYNSKFITISDTQIEKAIRKGIHLRIPNQYSEVIKSVNTGNPLVLSARSDFARALGTWADSLMQKPVTGAPKKATRGVLGILGM
jgi:pilus assembly protein CpaE